jgi:two-component system, cell cycle response regulator
LGFGPSAASCRPPPARNRERDACSSCFCSSRVYFLVRVSHQNEEATAVRAPNKLPEGRGVNACLIVLSGQAVGRIFKLTKAQYVVGRSDAMDIAVDDDGVSRRHATVTLHEGIVVLKDLESTNGTFVNGEPIRSKALAHGDRIQVGATTILKFAIQDELDEQFSHHLFVAATRDALTQTYNRRHFDDQLSRDLSYARRHGSPLTLALIDVDHFKRINDTHGHPAGDAVLQQFSSATLEIVRNEDFLCRIGGEEFALVMRGTTLQGSIMVCERLRSMVEGKRFSYKDQSMAITVSIGIASFDAIRHGTSEDLVKDADLQLYEAKVAGRNRILPVAPTP